MKKKVFRIHFQKKMCLKYLIEIINSNDSYFFNLTDYVFTVIIFNGSCKFKKLDIYMKTNIFYLRLKLFLRLTTN